MLGKFATTSSWNKDQSSLNVISKCDHILIQSYQVTFDFIFHTSETMQSSNSEMVKVYKLIRNMIEKEPQKRIALERVLIGLNEIYPNDLDSNQRSAEVNTGASFKSI